MRYLYKNIERLMAWDEENRLLALLDNGKASHYVYDAGGERVIKGNGDGQQVSVNGFNPSGIGFTGNYSMYVNGYFVVNGSRYTKHYYIEGQRIVSKISERSIANELSKPTAGNGAIDYTAKQNLAKAALYAAYNAAGNQPVIATAGKSGKIPYGQLKKYFADDAPVVTPTDTATTTATGKYENLQFYYHPDHLGSSNYITDAAGEVYQHNEYFPYGETFVEERNAAQYTNYLFSGKELDSETGLYYFGARYYDARVGSWYGVDKLSDKYPCMSGFMYCAGNPIIIHDPDGNDWYENTLTGAVYYNNKMGKKDAGKGEMAGDGWQHIGKNGMFGKNFEFKNSDYHLVAQNGGKTSQDKEFPSGKPSNQLSMSLMLDGGGKAENFMSGQGYDKKPLVADVYSYSRDWSLPEPNGPVWLNDSYEIIDKVYSWTYAKQGSKGSYSILGNYNIGQSTPDILTSSYTTKSWERRRYDYNDSPKSMNTFGKFVFETLKYTWDILDAFKGKKK